MARSFICGFDMGSTGESPNAQGNVTVQNTTTVYGTGYALRCNPSSATFIFVVNNIAAGTVQRNLFQSCRFYMRVAALPTVDTTIIHMIDDIVLKTTGALTLKDSAGANPVTSTRTLSADGLWHRIEFDCGWNSSAGRRVFVDGESWASSSVTASSLGNILTFGNGSDVTSCDLYFDNLLVDDSTFATSGFPGDSKQVLLVPTAGNNAGGWTDGAGGTGAIFGSVDNIPPVGVAAATAAAKIKNATSTLTGDYVATMQTYIAAGIPPGSIINAVMAICNDSEEIATGTKPGGVWIASNPAQSATSTGFDYGADGATIQATFPTGWVTHGGVVSVAPSVTLSTAPTVTVRKAVASTRVVGVDFLGMYVDYSPPPISKNVNLRQSVNRAGTY